MNTRRAWTSWLIAALPLALGLFFIGTALLPYSTLKGFIDSFLPDHNFNSLKPSNSGVIKVLFGAVGFVFLSLAALTGFQQLNPILRFIKTNIADARRFFADLRPQKNEYGYLAIVLLVMLLGIIFTKIISAVLLSWLNRLGGAVLGIILGAFFAASLLAIWVQVGSPGDVAVRMREVAVDLHDRLARPRL